MGRSARSKPWSPSPTSHFLQNPYMGTVSLHLCEKQNKAKSKPQTTLQNQKDKKGHSIYLCEGWQRHLLYLCVCLCVFLGARWKENLKAGKVVKSGYLENTFPTLVPLVTTFQACWQCTAVQQHLPHWLGVWRVSPDGTPGFASC